MVILTIILVPLIALLFDHQNHSKLYKWCHVGFTEAAHDVVDAADDREGPWPRRQSLLGIAAFGVSKLMRPNEEHHHCGQRNCT